MLPNFSAVSIHRVERGEERKDRREQGGESWPPLGQQALTRLMMKGEKQYSKKRTGIRRAARGRGLG